MSAGAPTVLEVARDSSYPPEIAATVYACFLEELERSGAGSRATVTVREDAEGLAFEVTVGGPRGAAVPAATNGELDGLRDRVEALGGRLTIRSDPGGIHVSGSLPLSR